MWLNSLPLQLTLPFEVVHVDAHADLGSGSVTFQHVLGDLIHKPADSRFAEVAAAPGRVKPGNFLFYALALRWLSRLTYVHHEKHRDHCTDVPKYLCGGEAIRSGSISLPRFAEEFVHAGNHLSHATALDFEPTVPFVLESPESFTDRGGFDFVFAAHSPWYTPSLADPLLDVLREYIDEDS